jgi:hypothetical protein
MSIGRTQFLEDFSKMLHSRSVTWGPQMSPALELNSKIYSHSPLIIIIIRHARFLSRTLPADPEISSQKSFPTLKILLKRSRLQRSLQVDDGDTPLPFGLANDSDTFMTL